jgi:hypothetical protein
MHSNKHGYVSGAALMIPALKKIRDHVEWEKFWCRLIADNETTQEFKLKTEGLSNKIYAFRFNSPEVDRLTLWGKKNANQQPSS